MTLTGSLLFVNLTNPHPFTLGVQALDLATQAITFVASFGPSGSFYDQVGTPTTSQERVVVASTEAGRGVLLELDPKVGNMVDLAYTPISY